MPDIDTEEGLRPSDPPGQEADAPDDQPREETDALAEQLEEDISMLTGEQSRAFHLITGSCPHMDSGSHRPLRNFFITGGAGTGKSYLVHVLKEWYSLHKIPYQLVCSTGVAAVNIDGRTLNSAFHLRENIDRYRASHEPPFKEFYDSLRSLYVRPYPNPFDPDVDPDEIKAYYSRPIRGVLIIDEISCVSPIFLEMLFTVMEEHNDKLRDFQVIVMGDFYQLRLDNGANQKDGGFLFTNIYWKFFGFYPIVLTEVIRQPDPEFADALNRLRIGDPQGLSDIYQKVLREHHTPDDDAVNLYSLREDVVDENVSRMNSAVSSGISCQDFVDYKCEENSNGSRSFKMPPVSRHHEPRLTKSGRLFDGYGSGADAPVLKVWREAHVMLTCNQYTDPVYYNGQQGIVTDWHFDPENPANDRIYVDLGDGTAPVAIERRYLGSYYAMPITLAYAITVHKAQGLTLDRVNVHLDGVFQPGQIYVAISRCRSLDHLYIDPGTAGLEEDPTKLADPRITDFYRRMDTFIARHH